MRIYLAAKVTARFRLREIRDQLVVQGHCVLGSWIDTATDYGAPDATLERLKAAGKIDLHEVDQCELFIIDTLDESSTGGREVELGYALGKLQQHGVPEVWRVGPLRNLYHTSAARIFDSWAEALEALKKEAV